MDFNFVKNKKEYSVEVNVSEYENSRTNDSDSYFDTDGVTIYDESGLEVTKETNPLLYCSVIREIEHMNTEIDQGCED